ncbi:MAG: RodZ domain-containing protein [Elainellaceae cyanobacterium]
MGQSATQPTQNQIEILAQIGDYLHQVREKQLLSLEQVATQTMIQARLLRAIETADFSQLPEPIYIRGFIKRYAESLGLEGSDIANGFPVELSSQAIAPTWQSSTQLRPTHLWIAYTLVIMVAVGGLHQYLTRFAPAADGPDTTEQTDAPEDTADTAAESTDESTQASETAASPTDTPAQAEVTPDTPLRVEIRLTQKSWVRVVVDGKQELEEVLPEGSERSWTGQEQIVIRAGNAGGVVVAQNGQDEEVMGDSGAVRELTFAANSQSDASSTSQ